MTDLSQKWSEAVNATPIAGKHIRPIDMPYEDYAKSEKTKLFNVPLPWDEKGFGVTTAGLGEVLTPDMAFGTPIVKAGAKGAKALSAATIAQQMVKAENPIFEITKLLHGGAARESIIEALTTKAKSTRAFVPEVAEDLV